MIVHMGDLDGSATPSTLSRWRATVVLTVHDATDAPRGGVTVRGTWDGGSTVSCVTNSAGTCSVTKLFSNSKTRTTFAVTRLSLSGYTYDAGANHDPDGDSTGTSIVVLRP